MQKRKYNARLPMLIVMIGVFIVLSVVAILTASAFENDKKLHDGSVSFSEMMLSNHDAHPDADGGFYDWIEIRNSSDHDIDISGYGLSDNNSSVKYRFPQNTVIKSGEYLVVFCDSSFTEAHGLHAPFGLSRNGGETVILVNETGKIIEEVTTVPCGSNQSYAFADGKWGVTDHCTPGFENSDAGRTAFLSSIGNEKVEFTVKISEVCAKNLSCFVDGNGNASDWIELINVGKTDADLTGCWISNEPDHLYGWQLPSLTLKPGERVIIFCSDSVYTAAIANEFHAPFRLKATQATVTLVTRRGTILDKVSYGELPDSCSVALQEDGSYAFTPYITPGLENTLDGWKKWTDTTAYPEKTVANIGIFISELMASQSATLPDADGNYPDWIELYNPTDTAVSLDGFFLSDSAEDLYRWRFPAVVLSPGSRLIVYCSGKGDTGTEGTYSLHTSFKLSTGAETVYLSAPNGLNVDKVSYRNLPDDYSFIRESKTDMGEKTRYPTPTFPNDAEGYLAYLEQQDGAISLLSINEVMLANTSFLRQGGKYHDWIELSNNSTGIIQLSDYYLSDDPDDPFRYRLPAKNLNPGGLEIILASGDETLSGKYPSTGFKLGLGEMLHLYDANGTLIDSILLVDYPAGTSQGRVEGELGYFYFTAPTPGSKNNEGIRFITPTPTPSLPSGAYNNVDTVTVSFPKDAKIYYTLDGSAPNAESTPYTSPIVLDKTTVIRAVAYSDDCLKSFVGTYTYLLNENHVLPVVSLSTDPDDMFHPSYGMYSYGPGASDSYPYLGANFWKDIELPTHVEFFAEGEDGFSYDCGLKIFGGYSRGLQKKSLQIKFREKYGAASVNYPVFENLDMTDFSSLVVRSGSSDYQKAMMRDEMFTRLAENAGMNLTTQASRCIVLYINGEYYGIYYLREKISEEFVSAHTGASPESVTMLFGAGVHWKRGYIEQDYRSIINYVSSHDMSKAEHYAYIESKVDVTSLMDWWIAETYAKNTDFGNIRYFKSPEYKDGKWHWIFYDLDQTWAAQGNSMEIMINPDRGSSKTSVLIRNLFKNRTFRNQYLERMAHYLKTSFSNETVIATITEFEKMLEPEIARNAERWKSSYQTWQKSVRYLKDYVSSDKTNRAKQMADYAKSYFKLTQEEYDYYFGDIPS